MAITNINELDFSKIYSYTDYLTWLFDERVELIKGKIFKMSPTPLNIHQRISSNLHGLIWTYLKRKKCKVYASPFDVRFVKSLENETLISTVVQPDLCVVCDEKKLDEKGCIGAPDLIIEIVSPHSAKRDIHDKFDLYQEFGVKEYWIVYPTDKSVQVFLLNMEGKYESMGIFENQGKIRVNVLNDLEIPIEEIFE
jgi:Uma2 family endonuclease